MLRSSLFLTILSILTTLISFINQLIIAKLFGTSMHMDAYLIAVSVPVLLSGALGAVLNYSMVPVLVHRRSNPSQYARFSGLMFLIWLSLIIVVCLIGIAASPHIVKVLGGSLQLGAYNETILMARISWITAGLSIIFAYLSSMQNAAKHFLLPVIAGMLPYIGMITFGIILGQELGPVAVTWGMFAGSALAVSILFKYALSEIDFSKRCFMFWKEAIAYFLHTPLVAMAMLCFTVYQTSDAYWAPKLGPANLAYLGYSQRLLIALGGIVIAGPFSVLAPRFAEAFAEGRHHDLLEDTGRAIRTLLAFTTPIALVSSILAIPIIELLFQRGKFDERATEGVASILPYMMTGMVAMICVAMLFRVLFAKRDIFSAALLGGSCAGLYFILSGVLSTTFLLIGIGLAYIVSWGLTLFATIYVIWRGNMTKLLLEQNYKFILHLTVTLIIMYIFVSFAATLFIKPLKEIGIVELFLRICIPLSIAASAFYVMSAYVFRMPDVIIIFGSFLKKLK